MNYYKIHIFRLGQSSKAEQPDSTEEILMMEETTDEAALEEEAKIFESKLSQFWEETDSLIRNAAQSHHLHNVAKFDILVDDSSLPDASFDEIEVEMRNEFSLWLFNKLADVCFAMLDYYQQYKAYLGNLKVCTKSLNENIPTTFGGQVLA